MPTPPPQQALAAFTVPVTTMERLSSLVALFEQLVQSSTILEASTIAIESFASHLH